MSAPQHGTDSKTPRQPSGHTHKAYTDRAKGKTHSLAGIWAFLREILLSCRSQGVTSLVISIIAAVSVALVLGTAGLSAAAQEKVLSTVDEVGTRSVVLYSKNPDESFPARILDSLERLDIVETAVGFGITADVTNSSFNGGKRVALRTVYGSLARELMDRAAQRGVLVQEQPSYAFATPEAFEILGLPEEGGGVRVVNEGLDLTVLGKVELPQNLSALTPTLLTPVDEDTGLTAIYLSTHTAQQVPLLSDLVRGEMREYTNQDYALSTSEEYARLRSAIDGELTSSSHTLIISVLTAGAGATMLVVWAVVLLRRKDLGRRRALGASRLMILGLMMGQVALLTAVGALIGTAFSYGTMAWLEQPLPPLDFSGAIVVALSAASTFLAMIPALWAANRDPLSELRVP